MTSLGIKPGRRRALAVGGALALAVLAVAPLAHAADAPTSLLPQPAAPAPAPAPALVQPAVALSGTNIGGDAIQIQQLPCVDPNAFGTLNEAQGGLPVALWKGTDASLVAALLSVVTPTQSKPMQSLMRRVLLTVATPPVNEDALAKSGGERLLVLRARALWTLGDADGLAALLKAIPLPGVTPALRKLRADSALLAGDNATACAEAGPLGTANPSDPYPVELRIYCQFAAGQGPAASLGVDVLREQKLDDSNFFALAEALAGNGAPPKGGIAEPTPLQLAMERQAKADQAPPGSKTAPLVLRSIALVASTGTPLEVRIAAAERAEIVGAVDSDTLRRLYESVPFTGEELAKADNADAKQSRGRALLMQAAEHQAAPLAKAGLIAKALNGAEGAAYFGQARIYAPLIAQMQPTTDIALYVPTLARALIADGQTEAARAWVGWLRAQAAADKSFADAAASFAVLAKLAKLDDAPVSAESLDLWRKAVGELSADHEARRSALGPVLLLALDEPVPPQAALAVTNASLVAAQVPPPAFVLGLDNAVAGKRLGEMLLLAYAELGDDALTQLDIADLARVVAALKGAGFETEARALALEIAIANGV